MSITIPGAGYNDDGMPWMTMVEKRFPFLYGMLLIEFFFEKHEEEWIKERKKEFLEEAITYFKNNDLFFDEDVSEYYSINCTKEFAKVLIDRHEMYKNNKHLQEVIKIAEKVIKRANDILESEHKSRISGEQEGRY